MSLTLTLRQRLARGEQLLATFVKTTSHQIIEVLATAGFDALVLDAEHAPFDAASLDLALMAARGCGLPALVRVPNTRPDTLLQVLDVGAAGVLVPHVESAQQAREIVSATRYRGGGTRGFSASSRAGGYGTRGMAEHLQRSDDEVLVMAQIESIAAVAQAHAIGAVDGIDCLFLGPADLAVSMDCSDARDAQVEAAITEVRQAARRADCPLGGFVASAAEARAWRALGAGFVVLATDQMLLRRAAIEALAAARETAVA